MEEYLKQLLTPLVAHPESVVIVRSNDDLGVLLSLSVHPEDMGVVIGKGGETARSIRVLLRILGSKTNARISLRIVEPLGGKFERTSTSVLTVSSLAPTKGLDLSANFD